MTNEQFDNLFATLKYDEARRIVRQEIISKGKSTGACDSKEMLRAKAVDGIPISSVKSNKTDDKEGKGTPPEHGDDGTPNGGGKEQEPQGGGSLKQGDLLNDAQRHQQEQGKQDGGIKSIEDAIKQAEEEAKKREEEAQRQKQKADEFKKKLEEMKRKIEEERKKQEQEKRKGGQHCKTDDLIDTLKMTGLAYLVGPAGTGKSTLAMDACKVLFNAEKGTEAFNKVFAQISFTPDTTSGEMIGRSDVNGNFHESEVVRVFRDGGLILFDEIDDADSAMLIKLNTAIANGFIATPNGMVKRNENTYIVCTANTFGTGPDAMYVGRTRLDAATLDRFTLCTIEVDYDTKLEKCIANPLSKENREWLMSFVKKVRKVINDNKFRRLCSTRFVINATKFLANGKDTKFVEDRFLTGWSDAERTAVKAA